MTKHEKNKGLLSVSDDTPEVKPKHAGGRPSKDEVIAPILEILDYTAPKAMDLLSKYIWRKKGYKAISRDLLEACKYVIDHAIGKSRQKVEHIGGALTYKQLAENAEKVAKEGRDVLADVADIANKYQGKP